MKISYIAVISMLTLTCPLLRAQEDTVAVPPANTMSVLKWNEETKEIEYGSRRYAFACIPGDIYVRGGSYEQRNFASRDEYPLHATRIDTVYIGKTEVPQWLWVAVMKENPSSEKGDSLPVDMVSWTDCQLFMDILGKLVGKEFFFPNEKQWEAAARGGNNAYYHVFSGGNDVSKIAWHDGNSDGRLHPVGEKEPNEFGLYDMSGNVAEWCYDWYGPYQGWGFPIPSSGTYKSVRGGSFSSALIGCRISARSFYIPDEGRRGLGLRLMQWDRLGSLKKNPAAITPPVFFGSNNNFTAWVNKRLVYPPISKNNEIYGTVVLKFKIEKDGKLSDIKVIHGVDGYLEKEAVRVVSKSPKWTPAQYNGEPVEYYMSFEIRFVRSS